MRATTKFLRALRRANKQTRCKFAPTRAHIQECAECTKLSEIQRAHYLALTNEQNKQETL